MTGLLMTRGTWEDLEWTIDSRPAHPSGRAGLAVFRLPRPLEPFSSSFATQLRRTSAS